MFVYILYGLWLEMLDDLFFFSVTPESIVLGLKKSEGQLYR
jgi:hypothetical protein